MGNQESRGQDFIDQFTRNYRFDKDVTDNRLGDIKVFNRIFDDKEQVAVKVYPRLQKVNQLNTFAAFKNFNGNLIEINEIRQMLKQKQCKIGTNQNDHPNLIKLYAFKVSADEELTLYYEYCYTNVKEQIDMRITHGYYFSAEELWRTILSVIMAGYYLETQNRHIGDINTKRMFINKKGIVKVPPYMQCQTDIDSFKRAGFFNEYGYLSPECLEKFKQRDILAQINYIKNDVYGLGMSILEIATLKSSANMYDWDKYEINQTIFEERQEEVRQRYGDYLLSFLKKLLSKDSTLRFSFSELLSELQPYQQQIITGVGFSDIQIFKSSNGVSGFDSIIRKLDGINVHQKQESQASTQYQGQVTTKISNLPSIYSSADQSRSLVSQQQNQLNFGIPASVQINLSPTKLSSQQPTNLQQKQFMDREYYKFKTEESDTSIINKGLTNQEVAQIYSQSNNNAFGGQILNNIITKPTLNGQQTFQMQNSNGFNTTRENTLKYKISNVNRPNNPDQRSLSPSPVLHMQVVNNNFRLAPQLQQTPISLKNDKEIYKKTPIISEKNIATDRVEFTQTTAANQINLNDYKKTPIPIKKITLNNILNQNLSAKNITTQPNQIVFSNQTQQQQPIINNISQENIYNGNIIANQTVVENKILANRVNEPMVKLFFSDFYKNQSQLKQIYLQTQQVQINIPVHHRTNRNMIISPYPHNQRSVSPSHFMVQRSITPNVRPSIQNQIMFVSPNAASNTKIAHQSNQTINTNNIHFNVTNFNKLTTQDIKKPGQFSFSSKINNISLPETMSPRFSIQTNPLNNNSNGNLQGYNTDRHVPQSSLTDQKLQQIIQQNSSTGFIQKNRFEYGGLSPKAQ